MISQVSLHLLYLLLAMMFIEIVGNDPQVHDVIIMHLSAIKRMVSMTSRYDLGLTPHLPSPRAVLHKRLFLQPEVMIVNFSSVDVNSLPSHSPFPITSAIKCFLILNERS